MPNHCNQVYVLPDPGKDVHFKNVRHQQWSPFAIYTDFEALTTPVDIQTSGSTKMYQHQTPISVAYKVVSRALTKEGTYIGSKEIQIHHGADSAIWLTEKMQEEKERLKEILFDDERLHPLTWQEETRHHNADKCYICKKPFGPKIPEQKVMDHDHVTGLYRGPAHSKCNLMMRKLYKIPVVFHNFKGYDSHLLVWGIAAQKEKKQLSVIAQGMEKYMMIEFENRLQFKDSMLFLNASLERLVANLVDTEKKESKPKFHQLLKGLNPTGEAGFENTEKFQILCQKGVYPYDWMNDEAKLEEKQLPSIADFRNGLRDEECDPEDYERAQKVWKLWNMKTFRDYHELYLKCKTYVKYFI